LIINGDSTNITPYISKYLNDEELSAAVTSPPYFNAREYSQWDNLLCYLIDMMLNAKAVLSSLNSTGTYIYNIGDVVGKDNIFIHSNMSKRRQMRSEERRVGKEGRSGCGRMEYEDKGH